MKKSSRIVLVLITILFFTSCIRVETVIRVNKDGSGTITENVMMSKAFADMMRSFGESFGAEEEGTQPFSLFDKEKLTSQASEYGAGVTYQSGREIKEKDWEGYSAVYAFTDISQVKLNTSQDDKVDTGMTPPAMDDTEEDMGDEEFYYFAFERGKTPTLIINRSEVEMSGDEDTGVSEDDEIGEMDDIGNEMMKMFEGMRFSMTIEVDGKISNTNASYRNGSSITLLDMDFGKMMKNKEAFTELTKKKPETTLEMKAFMEKFDGLMVELEQPVTVRFK